MINVHSTLNEIRDRVDEIDGLLREARRAADRPNGRDILDSLAIDIEYQAREIGSLSDELKARR